MRDPKDTGVERDALMMACGCFIGLALVVELRLVSPDNPIAAVLTVILACGFATGVTVQFWKK